MASGRALALDVGDRRIGVAIGDPTGTIARPLTTLHRGSREKDFAALADMVAQNQVALVVVGRPLSLDGTEGPQARKVTRYALALARRLAVPIVFWDERYSTAEASEILQRNRTGTQRGARTSGELDAIAAAVILQRYLDAQQAGLRQDDPHEE
jgi:putative Holliday junction resolvase